MQHNNCTRCCGDGRVEYHEDNRIVSEVCYHCDGSGKVDQETDFYDKLYSVANALAVMRVNEIRNNYNSVPDGEGWAFLAAENQMSERNYTLTHVYEYTDKYMDSLDKMSRSDQELLIAWNSSFLKEH